MYSDKQGEREWRAVGRESIIGYIRAGSPISQQIMDAPTLGNSIFLMRSLIPEQRKHRGLNSRVYVCWSAIGSAWPVVRSSITERQKSIQGSRLFSRHPLMIPSGVILFSRSVCLNLSAAEILIFCMWGHWGPLTWPVLFECVLLSCLRPVYPESQRSIFVCACQIYWVLLLGSSRVRWKPCVCCQAIWIYLIQSLKRIMSKTRKMVRMERG